MYIIHELHFEKKEYDKEIKEYLKKQKGDPAKWFEHLAEKYNIDNVNNMVCVVSYCGTDMVYSVNPELRE